MAETANHIFLPWVQPGVAANIPDEATETLTAAQRRSFHCRCSS